MKYTIPLRTLSRRWPIVLVAFAFFLTLRPVTAPLAQDAQDLVNRSESAIPAVEAEIQSRGSLELELRWSDSGIAFNGDVLVSDMGRKGIFRLTDSGEMTPFNFPGGALEVPDQIRPWKGGFAIEDEGRDVILFIEGDHLTSTLPIKTESPRALMGGERKVKLSRVYDWVPLGSGALAFGDFQSQGVWNTGFVFFDNDKIAVLYPLGEAEALSDWYIRTSHYVEALGDDGFFVAPSRHSDGMAIYRVSLGPPGENVTAKELTAVPERYAQIPYLDILPHLRVPGKGRARALEQFKEIERKTAVMGLYGFNGNLHLLARAPAGESGASWSIFEIDATTGQAIRTTHLPTNAPHLVAIPKSEAWTFIEKGRAIEVDVADRESTFMRTATFASVKVPPFND